MKRKYNYFLLLWLQFFAFSVSGQTVSLYEQFNGRFDFTFIGNTLNQFENNNLAQVPCVINTSASATLDLQPNEVLEKAYLYWAGSGPGDFEVKLNDQTITADRTFNLTQSSSELIFFSAFKDITVQVATTGNGIYTLSELDLTEIIVNYCGNGTNFAGWAILLIYKNEALPLNQLNVYDGLDFVGFGNPTLNLTLDNLNVIDADDAKIGFIAWEGDAFLSVNETLRINGIILSNPPLNPANNAFNGTNSVTGSNQLYNMDLDIYPIQNNIQPGDQSAEITLTSGQDFVMINTVVTKLNSQVPDATITIDTVYLSCNSTEITVDYTVYNLNSTNPLPANAAIAIYANTILVASTATQTALAVGESESNTITFTLPVGIQNSFTLLFAVDDNGEGIGAIIEINEENNTDATLINFLISPTIPALEPLVVCNQGFGRGTFNLNPRINDLSDEQLAIVSAYETLENAQLGLNPIMNTTVYESETPKTLYLTITTQPCASITTLDLVVKNCLPTVYNYISANEDGFNDFFFVDGLRDIFLNFEIEIYNRWGKLIWKGNQNTADWRGEMNQKVEWNGDLVPDGTYFYLVYLNDVNYPSLLQGYLYINR